MGLSDGPTGATRAPKTTWRGATRGTTPGIRGGGAVAGGLGTGSRGGRGSRGAGLRGESKLGAGRTSNLSWRAGGAEGMGSDETGSGAGTAEATPEPAFTGYIPALAGTPAFIGGGSSSAATPVPTPFVGGALEVLGEDSDSRKLRFESTMTNNRYMELKPFRESQRISDIKNGFIPDPLKPMRLDEATNFLGTCEDMCPEFEREEREYQKAVDVLERYPGTTRIDPEKAVKAFHRPAAGNDQPLPSDVRPPHILKDTLDYLFHTIVADHPLHATHPFLRDRTRAIRQDFTMQNERGPIVIECNERIARYHILALGALREQSGFSESQELEQLRKVLKSLNEFYDDARLDIPPIPTPNEAEFRSYNILTHLRDPDIIWSTELLPLDVFNSPLLQTAITLHALAQRSNTTRGERASLNAFSRFFKLISRPEVPYLFGCILSTHFADVRRNALEVMRGAYIKQHSGFPAATLTKVLGCDDDEEVLSICEAWGLVVAMGDNGKMVVMLHKAATMNNAVLPQRVSQRLVEAKRGSIPYYDIIDGTSTGIGEVPWARETPILSSSPRFRRVSVRSPPLSTLPSLAPSALPTPTLPPKNALSLANRLDGYFPPTAPSPLNPFAARPATLEPTPFVQPTPSLNPFATSFVPPPALNPFASAPASIPFSLPTLAPQPQPLRPIVNLPSTKRVADTTPHVATPLPPSASLKIRKPSLVPTPSTSKRPPKFLTNALTTSLTLDIIRHVIRQPIRRASELALKEQWESVSRTQRRHRTSAVDVLAWGLTEGLMRRVSTLGACEAVTAVRMEGWLKKRVFEDWTKRTEVAIIDGEMEQARREGMTRVAEAIQVGPVVMEEEEEEEDGGLDMGSLSIGIGDVEGGLLDDWDMAGRIKQKQLDRERLWEPGTFLSLLLPLVSASFSNLRTASSIAPRQYSVVVSTESSSSGFASWLACKFSLAVDKLTVQRTVAGVEVDVRCVDKRVLAEAVAHAGLIVFDCTISDTSSVTSWKSARERLHALVSDLSSRSPYQVSLLILLCPTSTLSSPETTALRNKIHQQLCVVSLEKIASTSIVILCLEESESQMKTAMGRLLSQIVLRPERVVLPLSHVVNALMEPWSSALRSCIASNGTNVTLSPTAMIGVFVDGLNAIIAETVACASSPPTLQQLPPLPPSQSPLRIQIETYINQPYFASAPPGHFLLLSAALSTHSVLSDFSFASNLLDHLADLVLSSTLASTTSQELLDHACDGVESIEAGLEVGIKKAMEREREARRKRKASEGTDPVVNKKASNGSFSREVAFVVKRERTSLGSLNSLMKDAQALLQ